MYLHHTHRRQLGRVRPGSTNHSHDNGQIVAHDELVLRWLLLNRLPQICAESAGGDFLKISWCNDHMPLALDTIVRMMNERAGLFFRFEAS